MKTTKLFINHQYILTVDGFDVATNLTKRQAIKKGKIYMDLGTEKIGIGKFKKTNGVKFYILRPLSHYI